MAGKGKKPEWPARFNCATCGLESEQRPYGRGKPYRHCATHRMNGLGPRPCPQCGENFTGSGKRYCSRACRERNDKEAGRRDKPSALVGPPAPCRSCGAPRLVGDQAISTAIYCSRACSNTGSTAAKNAERSALRRPLREARLKAANDLRSATAWAREEARVLSAMKAEADSAEAYPIARLDACPECGTRFSWLSALVQHGRGCPPCRVDRRLASRKADKAIDKARRRSREKAIGAERVDYKKLCLAYGQRCFLCETATPWALRGKNQPDSPEGDHWQPVTKGGAHTWENMRNLCRQCNGEKRDQWPFDGLTSRVKERERLTAQRGLPLL